MDGRLEMRPIRHEALRHYHLALRSQMHFDQKLDFLSLHMHLDKENRLVKVLIELLLIIGLSCANKCTEFLQQWQVKS